MNDSELESILKSVRIPARAEEYWEDFPWRVRRQLQRAAPAKAAPARFLPHWAWSSGLALACVIVSLLLLPVFNSALERGREFQRNMAQLPNQLHVLLADEHGMQYLVAERQ